MADWFKLPLSMARILYGVHGTGHGHAMRALTVARHFPEHEFLFVSHGHGAAILSREFPVVECPSLVTAYHSHRVALIDTFFVNLKVWHQRDQLLGQLVDLIHQFRPRVTLTDYEYFLPRAALRAGLPCLSLDHQHIITRCFYPVPLTQIHSYALTAWAINHMFSKASDFLVSSFFQPPWKFCKSIRVLPPLLRESVLARQPTDADHVLVYQNFTTFAALFPFLKALPRPVVVYGFDNDYTDGNLRFKKNSEEGFLDDLAACAYVICGGGHSLISEALYLGKPIISFPVKTAFEQFLNALYIERLGYGKYISKLKIDGGIFTTFEANLSYYQDNIRGQNFCGNQEIFALVEQFINEKRLTPAAG
jgi:uncharacterized protein (TIGR00661 family)